MSARIERVVVIIPARNEEDLIGRCLRAVAVSAGALDGFPVRVVVTLDACTDATAEIVREAGAEWVEGTFNSAGDARAAAVARAGPRGPSTWIASTDADTVVPPHWLLRQVELADGGADLILGTAEPDPADTDPLLLARWHQRHRLAEDHPHAHGANLGVRADVYAACGGFRDVEHGEDVLLGEEARARGFTVVATDTVRVLTSGRTVGRVEHGFAEYLRLLAT